MQWRSVRVVSVPGHCFALHIRWSEQNRGWYGDIKASRLRLEIETSTWLKNPLPSNEIYCPKFISCEVWAPKHLLWYVSSVILFVADFRSLNFIIWVQKNFSRTPRLRFNDGWALVARKARKARKVLVTEDGWRLLCEAARLVHQVKNEAVQHRKEKCCGQMIKSGYGILPYQPYQDCYENS